jgi:hypothetical protein
MAWDKALADRWARKNGQKEGPKTGQKGAKKPALDIIASAPVWAYN